MKTLQEMLNSDLFCFALPVYFVFHTLTCLLNIFLSLESLYYKVFIEASILHNRDLDETQCLSKDKSNFFDEMFSVLMLEISFVPVVHNVDKDIKFYTKNQIQTVYAQKVGQTKES